MSNGNQRAMAPQSNRAISTRTDFGGTEVTHGMDAMSRALAAQATAAVQARYVMALQRPRSWLRVRERLMESCKDPVFAIEAWYKKPAGRDTIEGFSIRFAEEVAQAMTNLDVQVFAIYDDDALRITRVSVVDLETNLNESREVSIRKVVERRNDKGREVVGERVNAYGDKVYIVKATEDEIAVLENAKVSKAKRNALIAMLRADIKAECERRIKATLNSEDAKDPRQGLKDMADGFAQFGVTTADLEAWLGHPVDKVTQGEVGRLRTIYGGIRNGEIDFAEEIEREQGARAAAAARKKEPEPEDEPPPPGDADAGPVISKADVLKYARDLRLSQKERDGIIGQEFNGRGLDELSPAEMRDAVSYLETFAANRGGE